MERNNTQARSDRKHHSKAIGKKTISRMQIVAKFSDYLKEIEEERLQLEKQRIEREHQQLVKQRLEREQQQLEKQRMEQEKQALEKRRLEQEHTEQRLAQQQIEEERQSNQRPQASQNRMAAVSDLLKSMGEEEARLIFEALKQKMEKPTRQIEEETQQIAQHPIEEVNQQQSQQQIEEENQQLPQQKFEEVIQHLSQQPIEEVEQQLPQQPIEEEIQQLPQQPIEEVEQQLPQQQIEEENQQLRQQQIQEENQQLPHQQIEEEYQQQSLTDIDRIAELRITRHINYAQDTTFQHRPDLVTFDTSVQDTAQGTIHGIPNNIDEWLQFRTEIHDIATIDENVERFETFKSQFNAIEDENVKEKLSEIEKILKIKFKWLVLNKILDEISNLLNARRFELTAQNVARCLEVTQKRNVTTPQVGFVTDHIFENSPEKREIIIKCITQSSESANNAIKRAVESFILEKSSTKDENDVLKQFYNKYHEVVTRANKILEKTESFKAELKKSKIQEAFLHQNVNVNDDAWPIDLVQLIRQDNTLRSLYDELVFMKKEKKRDWEKCCADEKIQDILKINIRQQGIMCKSYRILLAYLYDVNIRVYARDEDHEIVLIENHNPNSTNMTHILKTENEFIQLNINESHHQLEKERLHKDRIYRRILTEIDALPDIKHMQDYLNQKLYEQNSFNQEDAIEELGEDIVIEKIAAFFPEEERDN
ncbi:PH domain-containing protein DDB_G0275795-like, partial [Anopheles gambiae]|uniref:PH domain-containing protein DDB_G0275795-like n=1 Tax=Anopheles gambiae TaxID=7165 RepID=UPI002AC99A6B